MATARVPVCSDEGVEDSGGNCSLTCFSFFYIPQLVYNSVLLLIDEVQAIVVEFSRIFLEMTACWVIRSDGPAATKNQAVKARKSGETIAGNAVRRGTPRANEPILG